MLETFVGEGRFSLDQIKLDEVTDARGRVLQSAQLREPVIDPDALAIWFSKAEYWQVWTILTPAARPVTVRPPERWVNCAGFTKAIQMLIARFEQQLKWIAVFLGVASAVSVVQGWQLAAMLFSLPFCLIWAYCGWLHTEPQLKYLNIMFSLLYVYGIGRYLILRH